MNLRRCSELSLATSAFLFKPLYCHHHHSYYHFYQNKVVRVSRDQVENYYTTSVWHTREAL